MKEPAHTSPKILIVEDEESLLSALVDIYRDENFNVISASDGQEGLSKALKEHPDLVVLDILLPKLNGLELLKKLRQDAWGKTAKVIILTNMNDTKSVADALTYGVHTYFVKSDIDIDYIIQKTREQLNHKA